MSVTIKLFATFQRDRLAVQERDLAPGTQIRAIADELGIEVAAIGVVMANGRHVELDYEPRPGDVIAIFPVIGGG